jgi:hypothetical protein
MSSSGYGGQFTPPRPAPWPGFVVTLVLFTVLGGMVNLVFSFMMLFATDACGTGATDTAVCNAGVWTLLLTLPWAGLAGTLLIALLGGARARRRYRSPWPFLPAGAAVYVAACAVTLPVLLG